MDRVRVAVSIDYGILSPQPSLPRTRMTVVRPGWGAGTEVEKMRERVYSEVAEIQLSKVRIPEDEAGWVVVMREQKRRPSKIMAS